MKHLGEHFRRKSPCRIHQPDTVCCCVVSHDNHGKAAASYPSSMLCLDQKSFQRSDEPCGELSHQRYIILSPNKVHTDSALTLHMRSDNLAKPLNCRTVSFPGSSCSPTDSSCYYSHNVNPKKKRREVFLLFFSSVTSSPIA